MRSVYVLALGLCAIVPAVPLLAHHSFAAEYDSTKKISITGVVTKVEWMNPHARFYVDVKDESGKVIDDNPTPAFVSSLSEPLAKIPVDGFQDIRAAMCRA